MQLFSHLCAAEHCHLEGEAAQCEDKLLEVMLATFPMFHTTQT
jgi:hypothetical protein